MSLLNNIFKYVNTPVKWNVQALKNLLVQRTKVWPVSSAKKRGQAARTLSVLSPYSCMLSYAQERRVMNNDKMNFFTNLEKTPQESSGLCRKTYNACTSVPESWTRGWLVCACRTALKWWCLTSSLCIRFGQQANGQHLGLIITLHKKATTSYAKTNALSSTPSTIQVK